MSDLNRLTTAMLLIMAALFVGSLISDAQEDPTILWYKFDVLFRDEVEDLSPHGNHGQINAGVEFEEEGKIGGAARFTAGANINVPISDSLNPEESITIEFWIRPDDVPAATYWRLIHKGWVQAGSYICGIDNNWMTLGYTWDINNTAGVRTDANQANAVEAETWQYYSATYDGEEIILYVDGEVAVQTAAQGKINGNFPIVIAESFSGLLDEIRFSNVALSQEDIKKHMEGQDTQSVAPAGKLPLRWAHLKNR